VLFALSSAVFGEQYLNLNMSQLSQETGYYLDCEGDRIYLLGFGCEQPAATVLLCGPFPSDRLHSLISWVRWGRFLARHGVAAVRFDYRGTGESTGDFARMSFTEWQADIERVGEWAKSEWPGVPLVLHGLGMGGLLAQKVFTRGLGNALLLWSAPATGRAVLDQALILRLSMDMVFHKPEERKPAQEYIRMLKAGEVIDVDGYRWSGRLWQSAEAMQLEPVFAQPGSGTDPQRRPWQHLRLDPGKAPLVPSPSQWRAMNPRAYVPRSPLNPDLTKFFDENLAWIKNEVMSQSGLCVKP
jgi:alpha/beta superfamily hydrolase